MRYDFKNLDTAAVEYILTKVDFFSPPKKILSWEFSSPKIKVKFQVCVAGEIF